MIPLLQGAQSMGTKSTSIKLNSMPSQKTPASATTTSRIKNQVTHKFPPKKQWSLVVPSFVIHGIRPTNEASLVMPRKMDKNGDSVITPGLGIKYEGPNGQLLVAGMVKDCYDNLAGAVQYGYYSTFGKSSSWGLTAGIYTRETPIYCEEIDYGSYKARECYSMDKYPWMYEAKINGTPIDIMPMPFFHYSTALYRDADLQINFKMMSNIFLNEFAIAVPF